MLLLVLRLLLIWLKGGRATCCDAGKLPLFIRSAAAERSLSLQASRRVIIAVEHVAVPADRRWTTAAHESLAGELLVFGGGLTACVLSADGCDHVCERREYATIATDAIRDELRVALEVLGISQAHKASSTG